MNKLKTLKGACLVAVTSMLPLSQAAMADVTISGWINEGVTYYDDGGKTGLYQNSENGHTLGSRITFAGSNEVATGITAGFEVIIEPQSANEILGAGTSLAGRNGRVAAGFDTENVGFAPDITIPGVLNIGHTLRILGNSLHVGGAWGKVTVGLQSMPTDNIAVLEDPSLTLWSAISPVFVGNFAPINGTTGSAAGRLWAQHMQCGNGQGGIGIDCNGIYRSGVRYDLPAFGPVTVAVSWANDDTYDVAAKWKGDLGSMKASIALGYAVINPLLGTGPYGNDNTDNFQLQAGLMHPETGLFGSIAYQNEDHDSVTAGLQDDTDAWWLKVGIKKQWFSLGDTSLSFNYGQYNDQYDDTNLTGSEVERIGLELNQYFGSSLIIYGVWEQLDLSVDGDTLGEYNNVDELDTFRLGAVYFF
ncbi:MAG: porin [Proteobacteria bacterium]|nr:porin [Pseudomonadota bacterium]